MGTKRKSEATRLDEVDRTLYSTFCDAANSLSQLYTQAMNHQKFSFKAGELHSLEMLYEWILRELEQGSRVSITDIVGHIDNEIDYRGEASSQFQLPHQHSGSINGHSDQARNMIFANALSGPVCRSLQPYHLQQGSGNSGRNQDSSSPSHDRDSNSNDSSMDTH
ncbi:uncharacterized protein [Typha angustifolia]|uniref:uncharacterized protein isoform X1 n=1 Tax=Typha angustifolia TaxID=59011 RepID=UPI003C2FC653